MMRGISVLVLMLWAAVAVAQENDVKLANKYFEDKDYEKAALLYEQLYEKTGSRQFAKSYLASLEGQEKYQEAEAAYRKAMRKFNDDYEMKVYHALLFKKMGEPDKTYKLIDKMVDDLPNNPYIASVTARALIEQTEYASALKVYDRIRELGKEPSLFRFEKARVYAMTSNYDGMINEYIDLIEAQPNLISSVQSYLQYYLSLDIENTLSNTLRSKLLQRIRKAPDQILYVRMLAWLFLQQNNFDAAFMQVRAVDLKTGATGQELYNFARIAVNNRAFVPAQKAYEAILAMGETVPENIREASHAGLLEVSYHNLNGSMQPDTAFAQKLATEYKLFFANHNAVLYPNEFMQMNEVMAYFCNQADSALKQLEHEIANPRLQAESRAKWQLLQGDIQLASGSPYEALLTYGRVEKANKHNDIGHEAKFRKSRVAYFTGEFEWAKSQLDILKASTSKLIANDAMALSLLIKNNLLDDSLNLPLRHYAATQMLIMQHHFPQALDSLSAIIADKENYTIIEYALFDKAQLLIQMQRYPEAETSYLTLIQSFQWGSLIDDSLFQLAQLYQQQLKQPDKALEYYKQLMLEHPGSVFVTQAREQFRKLRGDAMQ